MDFFVDGLITEAQFSNYPFFLNNVVRSSLLAKSGTRLGGVQVDALVVLTKAHMFPASNSTLYYEQAVRQLTEFSKYGVFDMPIRVVGLFSPIGSPVSATWTDYPGRYSRAPAASKRVRAVMVAGRSKSSRCKISVGGS